MIVTRWKFLVESFSKRYPFYLEEAIPFIGTCEAAMKEADKRIERWESIHDDTIRKVDLQPDVPDDNKKRFV